MALRTSQRGNTRPLGTAFIAAAWIVALVLATLLFGNYEDAREHPNRELSVVGDGAAAAVALRRNAQGHYVAPGQINGHPVTFLVDTGATNVAVPAAVAERLALPRLARGVAQTAGGNVASYYTRLDEVRLGPLALRDVSASITPTMRLEEVLLGMSFLKHFELVQRGDTLTLRPLSR